MNVSKQVERIQKLQDRYITIQKDIQDRIRKMTKPVEKYIRSRLKEEFPGADFHFLPSFQCGCLSNKWEPQVFLYRVNDLSYSPDGYWYNDFIAGYQEFAKQPPPVPTRRLLAFLKTITEEVGVKITLVRQRPYWLYENEQQDKYRLEEKSEMLCC